LVKTLAICIPSYNCGKYIRETIESVLSQIDAPDEIIISDDHSTDDSSAIIEQYRDNFTIKFLKPSRRLTIGQHYRFLLENATSDFVTFLSADDVLFPNFVSSIRRVISVEQDVKLVAGACIETDGLLNVIQARGTGRRNSLYPYPEGFVYMASGNLYTVSFSAMDRKVLLEAPILSADADLATDWYWALWLTGKGSLAFVRKPLGFYRIHQSNAGHNNSKWNNALPPMLRFLIPHLNEYGQHVIKSRLVDFSQATPPKVARASIISSFKRFLKVAQAMPYRRMSSSLRKKGQCKSRNFSLIR
jgi:glycosyltransferase involved in cell wall biosynthesis